MFRSPEDEPAPSAPSAPSDLSSRYRTDRRCVDEAHRRMLAVTSVRHRPTDARAAADELTRALRVATATVSRALQVVDATAASSPRRARRHRKATRAVPPAIQFWATELVRLSAIAVWLRGETLDDLGVHLSTAVRVDRRAANSPHIAGLVTDPDDLVAATLHQPWIGVDLQATVDADTGEPTPAAQPSPSPTNHVTKAA